MQRTHNYTGLPGNRAQDQAVTESMGPIYGPHAEHLGAADTAVIVMRRVLMRMARRLAGRRGARSSHIRKFRTTPMNVTTAEGDFQQFWDAHEREFKAALAASEADMDLNRRGFIRLTGAGAPGGVAVAADGACAPAAEPSRHRPRRRRRRLADRCRTTSPRRGGPKPDFHSPDPRITDGFNAFPRTRQFVDGRTRVPAARSTCSWPATTRRHAARLKRHLESGRAGAELRPST